MSGKKDFQVLVRQAVELGCVPVDRDSHGHLRLRLPDGSRVTVPVTPSDRRGLMNLRAKLRRRGVPIPRKVD